MSSSLTVVYPSAVNISNITNANPAVVTTVEPHGYMAGLYVTIVIPYPNVMQQINYQTYPITILSPTTFSIAVDTTKLSVWAPSPNITVTPPDGEPYQVPAQVAQCIPAGELGTLANASNIIGPNNPQG
jgi:hypothetical protein